MAHIRRLEVVGVVSAIGSATVVIERILFVVVAATAVVAQVCTGTFVITTNGRGRIGQPPVSEFSSGHVRPTGSTMA